MRHRFLRGLIPALALAALPAVSSAGLFVGVSVNIAPPPLPVYVQPPCPEPGYIWSPGYWAWNDGGYYWVPGTWVLPPEVGLLWTPGYWGWDDDGDDYVWHAGYWAPHVGFYGGVNYGFGYDGDGFVGGYWHGGVFFYNRAVVHVGPGFVSNVYYHPVVYHATYEHVSFNGGPGGVRARPSHEEMMAEHEHHFGFTSWQQRQQRMAFADHSLRADYNHGRPPVAATARPAVFHGNGAFAARAAGGPVHFAPVDSARPMRSDRPSWASGQDHASRFMDRAGPDRGQPGFARPEQGRFESQPRGNFEARGNRPIDRPEVRPQPELRQGSRPQQSFRSQQDYRPQQSFRSQQDYRPQQSFRSQQDYRPQQSFRPQQDYRPQQSFRPQQDYRPQQSFRPQQDYRPQQSFRPQQDYRPQQSFRPQQDYRPQQNFRPQQSFRPEQRGGGEPPHRPPEDRGHRR